MIADLVATRTIVDAGMVHFDARVRSELLRVAAWRAGRSGTGGEIVHPRTGHPAPAADVVAALLEHAGPALEVAGDRQRVAAVLQRRVHDETGDLTAVVRAAVELTTRP